MELKSYQKKVIADLTRYLELLNETRSDAAAFRLFWQEKSAPTLGLYQNVIPGVPNLCFKVPTGGGKTFIACNAVRPIFDALPATKTKAVVWLVPSDAILTQTAKALKDTSHPYRQKIDVDFGGRVEVYTKQELLNGQNFNPTAVTEQLSVMVLSYDSFRGRGKEVLKAYQENSNLAEAAGAFVHCFTGVDTEIVRGFAIYEDLMPIIGLNNDDRYPAKTFSIIHELVHLIKRSSAVCNDMTNSLSLQAEEVFCNAVAGAVLVPTVNLSRQLGEYTHDEIDLDVVSSLADKFSISKEVICRRLLDTGKITQQRYSQLTTAIRLQFESERKAAQEYRKITGQVIPRNMSREAIDQNSSALCRTFFHGYREGLFDKQDISRYLGVKQNHVDKFIWEVSKW